MFIDVQISEIEFDIKLQWMAAGPRHGLTGGPQPNLTLRPNQFASARTERPNPTAAVPHRARPSPNAPGSGSSSGSIAGRGGRSEASRRASLWPVRNMSPQEARQRALVDCNGGEVRGLRCRPATAVGGGQIAILCRKGSTL